ncbi:TVP38/TMEM64 family protein [Paenibacillus sp. OAS669]|uniref:TVP38/TMEM64 family protein n=1 Tax=Paenibacillus sp. OAS669 TaxID=2663821 RepID=UPI0017894EEB|nr:VTT domain-containing protein [Paenibacillus sp. OAS669]MBE1446836.1 putative membrane protein YdjX (TVP38/TMEM64 family) [Paenibacillus sp. OAS669]
MKQQPSTRTRLISVISIVLILAVIAFYLYLLHIGAAQRMLRTIRQMGAPGILIGVMIQTIVNILPVPGEFTSIVLMEIYGPVWGGVYSWVGGLLGAIGAMYLAKWITRPFFGQLARPFLDKVKELLHKRETFGLLLLRFVPLVPYHLVNYTAGLLQVKLWVFVWTTAVGILPYTIAVSSIYAGVRQGSLKWGIIGGIVFVTLYAIGLYVKKRKETV